MDSLERIRLRTIQRKESGVNQVYEQHRRKEPPTPGKVATSPSPAPKCRHELYVLVPCRSCRGELRSIRKCEIHGTCTRIPCADKDVDMNCQKCQKEGLGYEPVISES